MKRLSAGLGALACLFLVSLSRLVQAQTTTEATGSEGPLRHGVAAEVTLTGTVSGSLAKAGPGMVVGSHLLLTTPEGPVDASLGRFGLLANGAIPVANGEQVEASGVIKTVKGLPILLVRVLRVGGEVYTLRNTYGVPLSPQARKRTGRQTGPKGESR